MKNRLITLKQLDQQLSSLQEPGTYLTPKQGWARTIRKALGITIKQLAKRLGINPSRVVKIESSEIEGATTLRTLQSVAEALDCTLAYKFIPRSSLEKTIKNRAREIARKQVQRTAHTMALEEQSVDEKWLENQITDLTDELLRKSWKHLWEE